MRLTDADIFIGFVIVLALAGMVLIALVVRGCA